MRHHSEDIPLAIQNACDIPYRPVVRRDVSKSDAILMGKLVECPVIRVVIAFAVSDGDLQDLALSGCVRERRIRRFHRNFHGLAKKFQARISQQRAG
jgi:hypothetical protein